MVHAPIFVLGSFVIACSAKVAQFPRSGESLRAESVTVEPGGKGFNLALGAARLDVGVDGLLAVGDDLLSVFAEPALENARLPAAMLTRFAGKTGSGIGFTDATGENCLAVDPGVNLDLAASHVRAVRQQVLGARFVLAQFEIADAPILEAFSLASEAGARTLLNPSPFRPIPAALLAVSSILVVNAVEAEALAAALAPGLALAVDPEDLDGLAALARALFAHGPDTLVVTLGAAGAIAFRSGHEPVRQPACVVDTVDTLGAGDAFTAGFVASLALGYDFPVALRRGVACGALATQRLGVSAALPTADELERFLREQFHQD